MRVDAETWGRAWAPAVPAGDPELLRGAGRSLALAAEVLSWGLAAVRSAAPGATDWWGPFATTYSEVVGSIRAGFALIAEACVAGSQAFLSYAAALEEAQAVGRRAVADAATADDLARKVSAMTPAVAGSVVDDPAIAPIAILREEMEDAYGRAERWAAQADELASRAAMFAAASFNEVAAVARTSLARFGPVSGDPGQTASMQAMGDLWAVIASGGQLIGVSPSLKGLEADAAKAGALDAYTGVPVASPDAEASIVSEYMDAATAGTAPAEAAIAAWETTPHPLFRAALEVDGPPFVDALGSLAIFLGPEACVAEAATLEELQAAASSQAGLQETALTQTMHGAERSLDPSRLAEASQALVIANRTATFTQGDGATVFVQEVNGRFNVVVQGEKGIITNLKRISSASLERLMKRYSWTQQ